jgi:hypothetical protein
MKSPEATIPLGIISEKMSSEKLTESDPMLSDQPRRTPTQSVAILMAVVTADVQRHITVRGIAV